MTDSPTTIGQISAPSKILIADDHALLRQGLRELLADVEPQLSIIEAAGLDEVLQLLSSEGADLLLIDLSMPEMDGAASLRALREAYPSTKVVVLTGTDDRATILDCLAAGIHGYVLKSSDIDEVVRALRVAVAGGVYVTSMLAHVKPADARAAVFQAEKGPPAAGSSATPHFTARQLDVVRLLAEGRSTKDIARTLNLGLGTVKVHLAAVYRVLNARNRTEAVILASKLKL